MTSEQLDAIEQRLDLATPGPWTTNGEWRSSDRGNFLEGGVQIDYPRESGLVAGDAPTYIGRLSGNGVSYDQDTANAIFVANARTDVSLLLARVRELEEMARRMAEDEAYQLGLEHGRVVVEIATVYVNDGQTVSACRLTATQG